MKKIFFILIYSFWVFTVKAQEELRFRVTQNTAEGAGIEGVSVRVDGTGSAKSNNDGFGVFPNLKNSHKKTSGDKIRIDAILTGYKVINHFELSLHTLPKDRSLPVAIILARNAVYDNYIKQYFEAITNTSLSRNYEKQELDLRKQIDNWSSQYQKLNENAILERKQLWQKIDSLQAKIDVLAKQKEDQHTKADLIASILATASENTEDSMLAEAFLLFKDGKFEEAQKVLEEKTIDKEKIEYEKEAKISEILKTSSERKRSNYISKCLLKAQLFELSNQNNEAIAWYEKSYKADSTYTKTLCNYALFLREINFPKKPAILYEKAFLLSTDLREKGSILNNLGLFYNLNNEKLKARDCFLEALKYRRQLNQKNDSLYVFELSRTLNNLGNFYSYNQDNKKAEDSYLEALKYLRQLSHKNESQYLDDLANILNNLGVFYLDNQEKQKAEECFLVALKYSRQLSQTGESQYLLRLAQLLNNLGFFYKTNQEKQKAEECYLEALRYFREFSKKNEAKYLPYLASTLNNMGDLYLVNQEMQKAEDNYLEALKLRKQLFQMNDAQFLSDLTSTLNSLGNLYSKNQEKQKAEDSYLETLKYCRQLSQKNEAKFLPELVKILNNLGVFYKDNQEKQKAEDSYLEALKYCRQLSQKNESQILPSLATILTNLGVFYKDNQEKQKAEDSYLEALKYDRQLSQKNESQFLPHLATTLNSLGNFYKDTREKQKAEDSYLEALKYCRQLSQKNESQFLPELAKNLNNLGIFYKDNQEKRKAEDSFLESLKYSRQLNQRNEAENSPLLAAILNNLGNFYYLDNHEKQKAEDSYLEALKYYRQLSQKNETQYLPDLAHTLENLGIFYLDNQEMQKAEYNYLESLWSYQKLAVSFSNSIFWGKGSSIVYVLPRIIDLDSNYINKLKIQKSIINFHEAYPLQWTSILTSAYGRGAWYALMAKEFKQAEDFAQKGLSKDPTQTWIFSNLAPALLLQNRWEEAKKIYVEKQNLPRGDKTMREVFLGDLEDLEKEGITHSDFEKVRSLLKK
jgi:tetratricopeptide (TPR) repeat protein